MYCKALSELPLTSTGTIAPPNSESDVVESRINLGNMAYCLQLGYDLLLQAITASML